MRSHARVVIIGGGSLGINLLYHLTKEGWTDIALIEKGELTSGSTWHAAGLCPSFNGNMTVSQIHEYTMKLYDEILPQETGLPSTFHKTGSLRIGFTKLEEEWFRNLASRAKTVGCEFNFISKDEARKLNPFMDFDKARVIVSTPNDGHVDPTSVVMPLGQLAKANGAEINRFTQVTAINQLPSGEWEVVTDKGTIVAEHVVNAGGCFAPEVGAMVGVKVPLVNLEHQYLITDDHPALSELDFELPVCRDSYTSSYIRQEGKGLLIGPYETFGSKPWALGGMDWSFDRELFPGALERLMPFLEKCMEIMPIFSEVGVKTVINGPITHTPDDNILAGPQAGLRNFWNLHGASIGIAQGGIGKFMAQWMVHGQTEINMAPLDSRRFGPWATKPYCITKAIEAYENMYTAPGANDNRPHARPMRTSPLHQELVNRGCVHGVVHGYEKPLWFKTATVTGETPTWSRSESHAAVAEECQAIMTSAGVVDISGSSKFEVTGKDAAAFLDHLSCNRLPAKDGRLSLTLFHGPEGGIMSEFSITRIAPDHFYLVSAIGSELKDLHWMQQHTDGYEVEVKNVTEEIGAILVTGPKSREILQHMTEDDLSHAAFPWLTAQAITLDSAVIRMIRVSYVGELGYELHMPAWQLMSIYESMQRVCEEHGITIRDFGTQTMNALRLEKAYRTYGHEFTEEVSAVEAMMDRFLDTSRDFIGAENLRQRQQSTPKQQLAYLAFDDDVPCECFGNEAVYDGDTYIGVMTSGGFGHRVGYSVGFAYITPEANVQGKSLTVLTTLGMRKAHVEMDGVYDPENKKLRA